MKDISTKNAKELHTLLSEKREALRAFRFSVSGSNARNVKEGKSLKRDIAQVLTFLNTKKE